MNEKEVKETMKTKAVAATAKHENVMYVGPSIPGVAIQNTVYTEIPDGAMEAIESCPAIRSLFIGIRDYSKAEEMIRKNSGYIATAFKQAMNYKIGRKEG